ncbi:MAG: rhomboid family intramembrane serine protease, partial [Pyrinomonadaceae bacterium]
MLFPIGDDNTDRINFPFVNYALIALNIIVFVLFQGFGSNDAFTYAFAAVPKEILTGVDLQGWVPVTDAAGRILGRIPLEATPIPVYGTILTSMFMHAGFSHIAGNMLYLWIFGDNLEDRLGHIRYACFYLVCGVIAALAHIFSDSNSVIPTLGASGAISGVLGGYLLLFPHRKVNAIIFYSVVQVPAFLALGLWIAFQIFQGYMSPAGSGGVAYMAHIGGFIAGLALIKVFAIGT